MKNVKPILIIRFPDILNLDSETINDIIKNTENKLNNEYFVLATKDQNNDGNVKFECFNSNYTEIEFKELQEKVLKLIK